MLRLRNLEQAVVTAASPAARRTTQPAQPAGLRPTLLAFPPAKLVDDYDPFHTGVAHFQHVHQPTLVTFVFSAGRHEPTGTCTFMTVDFSCGTPNPFVAAVPRPVDAGGRRGTYTWVSTATTEHAEEDGISVTHYALFSGGNSHDPTGRITMQSLLYAWHERADGSLEDSRLLWVEPSGDRAPARFCLLADLGALYDTSSGSSKGARRRQLSYKGNIDIVITGYLGINIYSRPSATLIAAGRQSRGEEWVLSRSLSLPPPGARDSSGVAYSGVAHLGAVLYALPGATEPSCLIVGTRSEWSAGRHGERPWQGNAPSLVYDFRSACTLPSPTN